ncbi:MAG: purine-nucleoside phosphorylase [Butyricicoccus sp.]|nr:purine-nucleoside phosphorylase [Butyricicoccus sp.]MBQ8586011.1 purine-nucleoside phosphorylase [Butyricicoccus sp.]
MYTQLTESAAYLRERLPFTPEVGLVLGSGLGPLAEEIEDPIYVPYQDIPHFPISTAPGHAGQFVFGKLEGKYILCMQGRLHGYEGHDPADIVYPIRVMKLLGVQYLIVTNAAGGINLEFSVGDLIILDDQINFTGKSPLTGPNIDELGPRFNDMTFAFSPALRAKTVEAADKIGLRVHHGVYIGVNGPQYETPAEIHAFRVLGADVVGMSTVYEVIAANHCSLPVLGISMVTNMAAGVYNRQLSGEEVIETAERAGCNLRRLIHELIRKL